MIDIVVYTSGTGSCEKYAKILSEKLNIPAVTLEEVGALPGKKVLYIGWLMAGKVVGLEKARGKFLVSAVVQVGMAPVSEERTRAAKEKNRITPEMAFFCKQGAFHMSQLSGPMKVAMKVICKKLEGDLKKKPALNEQERALYRMVTTGDGEPADWNVDDIVAWCKAE